MNQKRTFKSQHIAGCVVAIAVCTGSLITTNTASAAGLNHGSGENLPIGDGKVSTQSKIDYVWSCQTSFNSNAPGAFAGGSWIKTDGTYNPSEKPTVDGAVQWPSQLTITLSGNTRLVTGNDLPNHSTGIYPVSSSDDAFQYDRNPNTIRQQNVLWKLNANPTLAAQPSCLPMGPVGILLTGSYIFNALDAGGRDAVAHEIQDDCNGHPERSGAYHYHNLTPCLKDGGTGHSALVGYALDGFGIFGVRGKNGKTLTNADLDACHGHTHEIEWNSKKVVMYHYHATAEYPYTIGCYRGTPASSGMSNPLP